MCYSILIEQDLKKLELTYAAKVDQAAFQRYQLMTQRDSKRFKPITDNPRLYPNYFAPIVTVKGDERVIVPMRYRIRPAASPKEVPSKYNMFNARIDSLMTRRSWQPLFMQKHGIVTLRGFFEWVERPEGKTVIFFQHPSGRLLHTPVIYDTWVAEDGSEGFASFAVITRAPTQEILAAGHDRSPIELDPALHSLWLDKKGNPEDMINKIDNPPQEIYQWSKAEA